MFSLTCAQKTARILASSAELKEWEKSRQERSERLQAARRAERKHAARFPLGYGPAGRVPAYVEAHLLSLEASPLARPVFSCGRGTPPSSRRPKSAPATPEATCTGAVATRAGIGNIPATMCAATTESHQIVNPSPVSRRPTTAGGDCATKQPWQQRKRQGSASSPLFTRSAEVSREGTRTNIIGGRVRPATAPCSGQTTSKASSRRQRNRAGADTGKAGAGQKEAQLVEKLARLSGVQPGGDFPTVAALKTAVAIKALQVQLQECRTKTSPDGTLTAGNQQARAAWCTVSSSSKAAEETADDNDTTPTPQRRCGSARMRCPCKNGHRHRELETWDDRLPHPRYDAFPGRNCACANGTPTTSTAASILGNLTGRDPVFGYLESSSTPCPRRHPRPRTATPPGLSRGVRYPSGGLGLGAVPVAGAGATALAAAAAAAATAPTPQEMHMQACFRRLTVGTLIEVNRLHNPPRPVQAVLEVLACLLGWRKLAALSPSNRKVRDYHPRRRKDHSRSRCHHRPPRALFSNAYVLRNVLASIAPQRISGQRLSALAKRLGAEEAAPAKVRSANVAAAVLLEWILAVVARARVADDAAP